MLASLEYWVNVAFWRSVFKVLRCSLILSKRRWALRPSLFEIFAIIFNKRKVLEMGNSILKQLKMSRAEWCRLTVKWFWHSQLSLLPLLSCEFFCSKMSRVLLRAAKSVFFCKTFRLRISSLAKNNRHGLICCLLFISLDTISYLKLPKTFWMISKIFWDFLYQRLNLLIPNADENFAYSSGHYAVIHVS